MSAAVHVLVAFASQNGSTAGIAGTIAAELRDAGLEADCRPVAAVSDLAGYDAVVLGSGVFVVRSASDGGGFIAGHRDELARRAVWLFSAGPIGGAESTGIRDATGILDEPDVAAPPEIWDRSAASAPCADATPVMCVAKAISARGAARFGHAPLPAGARADSLPPDDWRDVGRVRAWARSIASALGRPGSHDRRIRRPLEPALRS